MYWLSSLNFIVKTFGVLLFEKKIIINEFYMGYFGFKCFLDFVMALTLEVEDKHENE